MLKTFKDKNCPFCVFLYFWTKLVLLENSNKTLFSFGEHIRSLREDLKLSLREVSEKIGIDTSLLGKIERDERQPTIEQIKRFAIFFNLEIQSLILENLSDQIAYKILDADVGAEILKVAEQKVEYFKFKKEKNECIKSF